MIRLSPVHPSQGALALSLIGTVVIAVNARADDSGGGDAVVLEIEACPGVSARAIRHILSVEIGDLLVDEKQGVPPASDRLTIRCAGNAAWVEASGHAGSNPVDRTFRLDDFPGDAAPRALALAGIELLASLSPAVRARTQAKHEVASPRPPAPTAVGETVPRARPTSLRIGLAGSWRTFFVGNGISAWGGQAQLGWDLGARWHLGADLDVAGAQRNLQLGETSATVFSGSAAFGLRGERNNFAGMLGLGARIGMARLAGSTSEPNVSATSVIRPWGGPVASAGLVGAFGAFALTLTAEAGYSVFTAEGLSDGATVLAVGGAWAAISLGAAISR